MSIVTEKGLLSRWIDRRGLARSARGGAALAWAKGSVRGTVGSLRGVIFDVDGTLVDSNDAHARAWVHAMREYGFEVARALQAPFYLFLVRKLGVPGQEELAMGVIASGDVRVISQEVVQALAHTGLHRR